MVYGDQKKLERQKRLKELQRKKKEEAELLDKATEKLDSAKSLVSKKKYLEAKDLYRQAGMIFKKIGWDQQAKTLFTEAENMETKIEDERKNKVIRAEHKRKTDEHYENREKALLAKAAAKKRLEEEAKNQIPPEIRKKFEETEYLIKKAEDRIEKGKYKNAISRYEYIIEIYKEIAYEGQKYDQILAKIEELKKKL